jgi:hypothetical protein
MKVWGLHLPSWAGWLVFAALLGLLPALADGRIVPLVDRVFDFDDLPAAQARVAHRRVASHARSPQRGQHTTTAEHMPESHREHLQWTPAKLIEWGRRMGVSTAAVVTWQLEHRPHPEQGYRACLGLQRSRRRTPVRGKLCSPDLTATEDRILLHVSCSPNSSKTAPRSTSAAS